MQSSAEEDDWLGTPRFLACAMVSKEELEIMLNGPLAEGFYADGAGFLTLVSLGEEDGDQLVGSYLVPRIYSSLLFVGEGGQVGMNLLLMALLYRKIYHVAACTYRSSRSFAMVQWRRGVIRSESAKRIVQQAQPLRQQLSQ